MKIACIGYGNVGGALADQLQRVGHDVVLATRDPKSASVTQLLAKNSRLKTAPVGEAVRSAELVVLATPFTAVEATITGLASELKGKILIDCTNPVGPGLTHGLDNKQSGTEMIQALLPATQVIKAFSIYGFENFENAAFPGYDLKPAMLFCGNDATAKRTVGHLLEQLGWQPLDVGGVEQALHLEHMTLLWIRMVRGGGRSPHTVWAVLTR